MIQKSERIKTSTLCMEICRSLLDHTHWNFSGLSPKRRGKSRSVSTCSNTRASRALLSKNWVGLYHSVTPAIGSKDLQTSLIFDVRKIRPSATDTGFKFLEEIPDDCETLIVGGRNFYLSPTKSIASLASARGKIGGYVAFTLSLTLYSILTYTTLTHIRPNDIRCLGSRTCRHCHWRTTSNCTSSERWWSRWW